MSDGAWLAIAAMAAATYGLRATGLLAGARLPRDGAWGRALEALPGCVLAAVVAPAVASLGTLGLLAAAAVYGVYRASGSVMAAMAAGAALVAAARQLGG
ncbi:AzlD domain-containing protein [Inmirania thermothiophila]|uniref:Branched-subunit amino acid transport protein AzlD n=1 Tax=Inmirania thermothiophila TaxID=1750597 RepID=A0A3N1Y9I1_9GAMM|nr:AzlD domain-containing protein [Inmirania thermothiophila]ROR35201.1 branched-subunit amino acid transport protein AzlD [Inmirania thermothiophila]